MNNILVSIKKPFSEKILSGEKRWELRKKAPHLMRGDSVTLWLYESGKDGARAVIGKCSMIAIVPMRHMPFGDNLTEFLKDTCVTKEHLSDYLPCCAWQVCAPVSFTPVPLSAIGMKRPPQSWQYLTGKQVAILEQKGEES